MQYKNLLLIQKNAYFELIVCFLIAWFAAILFIFTATTNEFGDSALIALQLISSPISAMSWFSSADVVTPIMLFLIVFTLFVKHKILRRIILQLLAMFWVIFGFVCIVTEY